MFLNKQTNIYGWILFRQWIIADTVSANLRLIADKVSANLRLIADKVSTNLRLIADTFNLSAISNCPQEKLIADT